MLYSNPPTPKVVPKRRKPVGERGIRNHCYYDPHVEDLYIFEGEKIITQNRFSPLLKFSIDTEYCHEEEKQNMYCKECEEHSTANEKAPRTVCFRKLEDFKKTARGHSTCSNCNCNEINAYIINNKHDLFTGYFCDPIYYPPVDRQLLFQEGYKKQLSNMFSRYNMSYFSKMSPIYKICKKFWKPQNTSPSCGIAAYSSGTGTVMETPKNHQSFQNPNFNKTIMKNSKKLNNIKGSNKTHNGNRKNPTNNNNSRVGYETTKNGEHERHPS